MSKNYNRQYDKKRTNYNEISKTKEEPVVEEEKVITKEPKASEEIKPEKVVGVVNTDLLNFRERPSKDSTIIRTITKGETVEIERNNELDTIWVPIKYNGVSGWVMKEFIDVKVD